MIPAKATLATTKDRRALIHQARDAAELLKALSHETRLLILCILAEGEKSVSELEEILDMPQAAVSQQLARLRTDGLVQRRRAGRSIFYSTANKDVANLIENLHKMFCQPQRPAIRKKTGN